MYVCLYQKSVCKQYRTKGVYFRYIQYIRISVIVQSRRVQLFLVNCLLINKFDIHVMYYLYIFKSTLKAMNFDAKNIIWLKFTINYSLFKLNYNWRHFSAISLTVFMLCVCSKGLCVCDKELVCKTVRLAFSCQTSAVSLPYILFPW